MNIPLYQIDAFTQTPFSGNPAAVCPLEEWLDDTTLQAIAAENNLSETAFFVGKDGQYALRWFTPMVEIDLCGHATLASAYVVFKHLEPHLEEVAFDTRSGELKVVKHGEGFQMTFPTQQPVATECPSTIEAALGVIPQAQYATEDLIVVFDKQSTVEQLQPDLTLLKALPFRGVIATAPGEDCDFVSRFFAPKVGIDEDPVTGSAHCSLAPYWAKRLGRKVLLAKQVSSRGGTIGCELVGDKVILSGYCAEYLNGTITL